MENRKEETLCCVLSQLVCNDAKKRTNSRELGHVTEGVMV